MPLFLQLQAKVQEKNGALEAMAAQYDDTARFLVQVGGRQLASLGLELWT